MRDVYCFCGADESTVAIYDANDGAGSYGGSGGGALVATGSWEQYYDDNGYPYWYDSTTGVSQYEAPAGYY